MYGIIPAAPPPDQSYELAPRGVGIRRDGGDGNFADQLARAHATASERSSRSDETRAHSAGEERREEAPSASTGRTPGDDDAEARGPDSRTKAPHKESNRTTEQSDQSQADKESAARTKPATSEDSQKKRGNHGDDKSADPHLHIGAHAQRAEQKDPATTGTRESENASKSAVHVPKTATSDAHATRTKDARSEKAMLRGRTSSAENSRGLKSASEAQSGGEGAGKVKQSEHDGEELGDSQSKLTAAGESEKKTSQEVEARAAKQMSADPAAGKEHHAESLVERAEQRDDTDRNRRVRAGQDPRERRIAAEKAGTRTVDAKAVSPAEADNTQTEKTVTREFTLDLSEGSTQRPEVNEGGDNSLSAGRIEVGLRENTSRPPTISQATQTLARRLNGELGDSIVRQAKVMLQDANNAELRLIIRPPELGRIRIRLQMENGHIAGRILVDNGSVREVVEQNLASLQRAFEEAGLEMGDLEVSTGDAREDADQGGPDQKGSGQRSASAGVESFGRNIEAISEYEPGRHRINLVA